MPYTTRRGVRHKNVCARVHSEGLEKLLLTLPRQGIEPCRVFVLEFRRSHPLSHVRPLIYLGNIRCHRLRRLIYCGDSNDDRTQTPSGSSRNDIAGATWTSDCHRCSCELLREKKRLHASMGPFINISQDILRLMD